MRLSSRDDGLNSLRRHFWQNHVISGKPRGTRLFKRGHNYGVVFWSGVIDMS